MKWPCAWKMDTHRRRWRTTSSLTTPGIKVDESDNVPFRQCVRSSYLRPIDMHAILRESAEYELSGSAFIKRELDGEVALRNTPMVNDIGVVVFEVLATPNQNFWTRESSCSSRVPRCQSDSDAGKAAMVYLVELRPMKNAYV